MEQLLVVVAGKLDRTLVTAESAIAGASAVSGHGEPPGVGAVQAGGVLPVPFGLALGVVAGVILIAVVACSRPVRGRIHHWYIAINRWIDAV